MNRYIKIHRAGLIIFLIKKGNTLMNNNTNPNYNQQPPYQGTYYGGYMPPNYNTAYPIKYPYAEAADNALSSMKIAPFVLAAIFFGLLCSRTIFSGGMGIGMTLLGIGFYALFCPFILSKNKKVPLSAWLLAIPEAAILLSFSLYSGPGYVMLSLLALLAIAMCQTTLMAGCTTGRPFSFSLIADVCTSYLSYPFMNMGRTFSAIFSTKKNKSTDQKKEMSTGSKILLGLVIAAPIVLILTAFLALSDKMFAQAIDNIIDALNISIGQIMHDVFFILITMLYVMPLVVTLRAGYASSKDKKAVEINEKRPIDAVIITTVLFAAALVYLLFVIIQFKHLFFVGGNLPEGTSYAEYCRSGFFSLVFVIAITTLVIALTCMFTRHNDSGNLPIYTKTALLTITLFDFIMMVSAAKRLHIYISEYNMTVTRLNAGILIIFMAICLVFTALKIIFEKLKISAFVGSTAVIMMAIYSLANIDGYVAKYNIDKYFESSCTAELDIHYLSSDLSVAAIPQIQRLVTSDLTDFYTREDAKAAIADIAGDADLFYYDGTNWAKWTLDRQIAINTMREYGVKEYHSPWD